MSRSLKKGPYVDARLLTRVELLNRSGEKRVLKTWSRDSTIFPQMVSHTIGVHDGRRHVPIYHCVRSAIANAENNYQLDPADLYVSRIWADGAPMLKRWRPRAHGRVSPLLSRSSHVTVVVDERRAQ